MTRILPIFPVFCLAALLTAAAAEPARPAAGAPPAAPTTRPALRLDRDFELPDVQGTARRPLEAARADGTKPAARAAAKAVVFLFIATDCPISNSYAPEFNRICSRYGRAEQKAGPGATDQTKPDPRDARDARDPRAFDFYLVHADPDLSAADAKKHASDYGYGCPVLMDSKKRLAGQLGAKATPEAFVVAPDGAVLYHGRIDDQYFAYGKRRAAPTTHDLRDALDAVLAGKPVAVPETKVIGCPIE